VTLRLSTWKNQSYTASLATTPSEWAEWITSTISSGRRQLSCPVDGGNCRDQGFIVVVAPSSLSLGNFSCI
jgi:hypothetical protein